MKTKFTLALMSSALLIGASLTSCSNEVNEPTPLPDQAAGHLLVKSPDMIAYSAGKILNKYGTKAEEELGDVTTTPEEGEEVQGYVSHNDIEINLSLNEKDDEKGVTEEGEEFDKDYISSHFSLHVRVARDVRVRIPVSADLYCPEDDMAIVKKHLEDHYVYGDQDHTLSLNIDGNTVTVKVNYDEAGFTIETDGINEDVIEYLAENYEDGLTFEIWNYYNTTTTREQLQDILNGSTVEFIEGDDNVDYYVNAFNQLREADEEGNETSRVDNPWDCTVSIVTDQAADFELVTPNSEEYHDGFHGYNGSNINQVYKHIREAEETEPETDPQAPAE